MRKIFLLMLGFILALHITALATEYYVSNTGDDSNIGDASNPWQTLQHAVDAVSPGDTILLLSGNYTGCVITSSGEALQPCVIKSAPGNLAVIDAIPPASSNDALIEIASGIQFWHIENIELTNASGLGVFLKQAKNIDFKSLAIHDCANAGFWLDNCEKINVSHCTIHGNQDASFEIDGGSSICVLNCLFYDFQNSVVNFQNSVTDFLFGNNTVHCQSAQSAILDLAKADSQVRILNNLIISEDTTTVLISIETQTSEIISDYNAFSGLFKTSLSDECSLADWQKQGFDAHSLVCTATDVFIDASAQNYSLIDNCAVCELGTYYEELYPITEDLAGNARISGYYPDFGAYEAANSLAADADADSLPNYWEHYFGLDPLDDADASSDPDLDDLTNLEEYGLGTVPNYPDTDGDYYTDGDENAAGTNPLDDTDHPNTLAIVALPFPKVQLRQYFNYKFKLINYKFPVRYTIIDGKLPAGLQINRVKGKIYGTPAEIGTFDCVVEVKDDDKNTDTQKVRIVVESPISSGDGGCVFFASASTNSELIWLLFLSSLIIIKIITRISCKR